MSTDEGQKEKEGHFIPLDLALFKFSLPVEWKHIKWEVEKKEILEYNPHDIKPGHGKIIIISKWMGLSKSVWAILNISGKRLKHYKLS